MSKDRHVLMWYVAFKVDETSLYNTFALLCRHLSGRYKEELLEMIFFMINHNSKFYIQTILQIYLLI